MLQDDFIKIRNTFDFYLAEIWVDRIHLIHENTNEMSDILSGFNKNVIKYIRHHIVLVMHKYN